MNWLKSALKSELQKAVTIEPEVIERRFIRGIKNLFDIYLPIVDGAMILDNYSGEPQWIAQKTLDGFLTITDDKKFDILNQYYNDHR